MSFVDASNAFLGACIVRSDTVTGTLAEARKLGCAPTGVIADVHAHEVPPKYEGLYGSHTGKLMQGDELRQLFDARAVSEWDARFNRPLQLWYLTFIQADAFVGACVIEAVTESEAMQECKRQGCFPRGKPGDVIVNFVPKALEPRYREHMGRLMGVDELNEKLGPESVVAWQNLLKVSRDRTSAGPMNCPLHGDVDPWIICEHLEKISRVVVHTPPIYGLHGEAACEICHNQIRLGTKRPDLSAACGLCVMQKYGHLIKGSLS